MTGVDEVLALFDRWGSDRYDETVTQHDHAAQCAALARRDGASDALVAAALLHDIGHLLDLERGGGPDPDEDLHHEVVGAGYLAAWFPASVTGPIALHVAAKRRRCVDPHALAGLSAGSARSLALQGGPMDADGCAAFDADPGSADALRLRAWDDAGKVDGLDAGPVAGYRALLERLARA